MEAFNFGVQQQTSSLTIKEDKKVMEEIKRLSSNKPMIRQFDEAQESLKGVRDHQATIHWSLSIQRTLHGPQIGWLSAASNMMSRAFCTSTSSQGPMPTAHHTLRALHHCVTKNMTTPATNTNVCAWIDKAHTRRFVRATLDADHLLL